MRNMMMYGCGPMCFNGRNNEHDSVVKEILFKLAKTNDSKQTIAKNIKTAYLYADKLEEAMTAREKINNLMIDWVNQTDHLAQCIDNLKHAEMNHSRNTKDYDDEIAKGKEASQERIENLKRYMNENVEDIERQKKTIKEAKEKLDAGMAKAKKAGMKLKQEAKEKLDALITEAEKAGIKIK